MEVTAYDAAVELTRLMGLTDEAIEELYRASKTWAEEENHYRENKAKAYLQATGTVPERQAQADLACTESRYTAHLADAMRQAALENVRARRAQLQALQTLVAGLRTEMQLAR